MSEISQELRDELDRGMVLKYEDALRDSRYQLSQMESQVYSLRQTISSLESTIAQQHEELSRQNDRLEQEGRKLELVRTRAQEKFKEVRRGAEEQKRQNQAALEESERRHREAWEALEGEVQALQQQRESRERFTQEAAERSLERAQEILAHLDRDEIERLDLRGDLSVAEIQLASAHALKSQGQTVASEILSAAYGAEEALRKIEAVLESRRAVLTSFAEPLREDASWLDSLLAGAPVLDHPDQTEDLGFLLALEQSFMRDLIERELRSPIARLSRWNGHGALVARLSRVRDLLGAEMVAARRALPAARAHEEARYDLGHIWKDLELRFGFIRYHGKETPGAWADPRDRKSTYLYFLDSQHGEIRIEVPWSPALLVHHEGRLVQRFPLALPPGDDAIFIGSLARRWRELAARLENPNWTPERQG